MLLLTLACAARTGTAEPADAVTEEAGWSVPEGNLMGSLSCVSTDQPALRYEAWGKSGGAMPGPDTPMRGESWHYGELMLYDSTVAYGGGVETTGSVVWSWDHSGAAHVSTEDGPMSKTVVYTTSVQLSQAEGLLEVTVPLTTGMTCTRREVWGIP